MNFVDWMNMNMVLDIAFLVFACAVVWKISKLQKQMQLNKEDIYLVTKNPQSARRKLKNNQK